MPMIALIAALALAGADGIPPAIYTDPVPDSAHPATMEVLHIPSGGVEINGVAYLAAGPGPHSTIIIMHGLPENEKNLDLAQAVRRAGWNAVTFNYRGHRAARAASALSATSRMRAMCLPICADRKTLPG